MATQKSKIGYINGIDVISGSNGEFRMLAFVNEKPHESAYIQVETSVPQLQAALQLASMKKEAANVYFEDKNQKKIVTRVTIMDRRVGNTR